MELSNTDIKNAIAYLAKVKLANTDHNTAKSLCALYNSLRRDVIVTDENYKPLPTEV